MRSSLKKWLVTWIPIYPILAISLILRLWNLPGQLTLVWDDEGIFMYQAWRLVSGDLPYKNLFLADTPLSQYLLGIVFKIFGVGPLQARGFIAIIGALSVFLVFLIGYEAYDFWTGFLAATVFSFDPIVFNAARSFRPDYVVCFLELLTILFFVKALKGGRKRYRWLSGAIFGLALLSKLVAAFLIPPIILSAVVFKGFKEGVKMLLEMAVAAIVVLAPFLLVFLLTAPNDFIFDVYLYHLLKHYPWNYGLTVNEKIALISKVLTSRLALVYPALISIVYALIRREKYTVSFILTFLFSMSFFFMKYFWEHYFTFTIASLSILAGSIAYHVPRLLNEMRIRRVGIAKKHLKILDAVVSKIKVERKLASTFVALILAALIVGTTLPSYIGYDVQVVRASENPSSGTLRGIELIRKYVKPGDFILTDTPFFAVMTGTRIPDKLNDLSMLRMTPGLVKAEDLIKSIEENDIKVVVMMTQGHRHIKAMPDYQVFYRYLLKSGFKVAGGFYEPSGFAYSQIYVKER